jgi:hypothetical protein
MSFTYSSSALSTIHKFFGVENVIYVEGEDDIPFWDCVLKGCGFSKKTKILSSGGSSNLSDYIEDIVDSGSSIIVALDRDLSIYLGQQYHHNQIIYSYSYSIENSLFQPELISDIINMLYKDQENYMLSIKLWMYEIEKKLYEMIVYNAANHLFGRGVRVFHEDVIMITDKNNRFKIDDSLLEKKLAIIRNNFSIEEYRYAEYYVKNCCFSLWNQIKGHYLESIVLSLMNEYFAELLNKKSCRINRESMMVMLELKLKEAGTDFEIKKYYLDLVSKL